ncbi:MAG: undecaprenyl/decaprenyl-phosphate alpha-N-acetylglucosaminyl 1-phosphate transferase [Chloroflexi bacterium]|nr:undecaprenyl/decaprenyl-phosphate alpha-N-acetylglucosaminyl 1-phosphate transferase [Chloroflexota bacterium]
MGQYLLIVVAALIFSVAGTPLAKRVAVKLGVVDLPGVRKVHSVPVPLLGGAAMYLAFILAVLFFGELFYVQQIVGILLGATLVSFLGIWDDKWGLRPVIKLLGQVAAALILVVSGVQVGFLHVPALNIAVTVLWVVGITNAMNLLDNMDGLSGGVALVASAFFLLIAAMSGQYLVAILSAAIMGACVGFLYYNFNPATIFMGDTGSLFLGFVLAAIGIKLRFPANYDIVTWMVPVIVLGMPIFDTTLVTISRLRRHKPVSVGGKDHVSHRLVALGFTKREAVMAIHLAGGALGMCALFVTQATVMEGYVVGVVVFLAAIFALVKFEQVPFDEAG